MRRPKHPSDKFHGVSKFNVLTGEQKKGRGGTSQLHQGFCEALIAEAERDEKIVAITAAMPSGTGLDLFAEAVSQALFSMSASRSSMP